MRKLLLTFVLLSSALAFGVQASQVTGLSCTVSNGQTFCSYTEPYTNVTTPTSQNFRYEFYRSTTCPITAGNLGSATKIAEEANNGGQAFPFWDEAGSAWAMTQTTRMAAPSGANLTIEAMSVTPQSSGSQLAYATGLAVYTIQSNVTACYAIVTHDTSATLSDSDPVSSGNISETTGTPVPVIQVDTNLAYRNTCSGGCNVSTLTSKPQCLLLHGSTGSYGPYGTQLQPIGDSTMAWQDGQPYGYEIFRDGISGGCGSGTNLNFTIAPYDRTPNDDFIGHSHSGIEQFWIGYFYNGYVQQYWPSRFQSIFDYVRANFAAKIDANKVYCFGNSMGGGGCGLWPLRQTGAYRFAYIQVDSPVWWWEGELYSMVTHDPVTVPQQTTIQMASDHTTTWYDYGHTAQWILQDCSRPIPFVAWTNGRQDATLTGNEGGMWKSALEMAAALKQCHYGFAFAWNNGDHSSGKFSATAFGANYGNSLFALNVSYPAFGNFSLDDNPCTGPLNMTTYNQASCGVNNGAGCNTGTTSPTCTINSGFTWTVLSDTSTVASYTIANSNISSTATVDITPRNTQSFKPAAGSTVSVVVNGGAPTNVTTDAYGLATITGATLNSGSNTITFTGAAPSAGNSVKGVKVAGAVIK